MKLLQAGQAHYNDSKNLNALEIKMTNKLSRNDVIKSLTAKGEDYELNLQTLYGRECRTFVNGPQTLRELFDQTRSGETFIVYNDERITYEDAYQRASQIAKLLKDEFGVVKGDRVAISMRNYPEWILSFMAITSIGGIAVAMNSLWTTEEMAFGLTDSGAKVLFADEERLLRIESVRHKLKIDILAVRPISPLATGIFDFQSLIEKIESCEMPEVDVTPLDDATLMYTSGSTGHPKGAVACHRNIVSALLSWELEVKIGQAVFELEAVEPRHQVATLLGVPLFHATGLLAALLLSYRAQRKVVAMYKWDVALAADLIEAEKINSFVAPAAMTGDLVTFARSHDKDLSSLDTVGGGGAPRAPEQVKSISQSFGKALPNTGWGMTETNAIGAGIGGEDYLAHPSSSGRCAAVLDMKIVNEDGETLDFGSRGELLVKGTSIIRGYWNRPEANAETFIDGWLKTGDVAYLDEEGYLYIVDRIKDLVIRGGENIGCAEVEAALLAHPLIKEASVYAVPDERLGEEVGASLMVSEKINEDELRGFLIELISRFKIPRYLRQSADALPRIASGKIDKKQIREAAVKEIINKA
ncbi:MAG: long-chain acyl-CoA synthetase [Candidatus Azotimanducaceae bacterium]|jgi:long-chain acyl-CoA synthetase